MLLLFVTARFAVAEQPLADLAETGQWAELLDCLENDDAADINAAQPDGATALHWAAFHGHERVASALIARGADVNALNTYDVSPLSLASELGHAKVVKALLDAGADKEQARLGGERPLMLAARHGNPAAIAALIKAQAHLDAKESRGQTALMWAAAEGNLQAVKLLIDGGANRSERVWAGFTSLLFAARNGKTSVVRYLVQSGSDVHDEVIETEKRDARAARNGMGALLLAVESGHFETALELVKLGADPNDQRSGFAPLHAISWVRRPKRGDDPDGDPAPSVTGSISSLMFVRQMVQQGADINLQIEDGQSPGQAKLNPKGATPFLFAARTCDLDLMRVMLDLGADPKIANSDGSNSLMAAAGVGVVAVGEYPGTESECCEAIALLQRLGVDLNAVDTNGETAMHGAAYRAYPTAIDLLAQLGADPAIWNKENRHGWTPYSIANGSRPGSVKPSPETANALDRARERQHNAP